MNTTIPRTLIHCILISACIFQIQRLSAAPIQADFDDGNTTSAVDAYTGMAGDGWAAPWQDLTGNGLTSFTNTVEDTDPLNSGGNYLNVNLNYTGVGGTGQGTISREFSTSSINTAAPIQYQFDFRMDIALTDTTQRYFIFNRVGGAASGTDLNNTWAIQARYNDASSTTWWIINGNGSGGVTEAINTEVSADQGTAYTFMVHSDPENKAWNVNISDGTNNYTSDALGYRANSTNDGAFLHFGALATPDGSSLGFSVDNIQVALIPEPAQATILLGLSALLILGLNRRRASD
ncbi:hypothetical protein QEH59_14195 [Coraliomargarita sp. SDUM461004]|uniref:PEP-CTERM protein-sorting domain-containing protein n=1 Tax=Thalassobacterium sedimentorum TaxID=3041258 RepID=A0ABU1AP08_9BACT|nr:hypothetical protein [Coraliomargarita sp. SDUM461004]MDQ8195580.1 hypothetical protein [Coraliomargarita sp. SDUM461004]